MMSDLNPTVTKLEIRLKEIRNKIYSVLISQRYSLTNRRKQFQEQMNETLDSRSHKVRSPFEGNKEIYKGHNKYGF